MRCHFGYDGLTKIIRVKSKIVSDTTLNSTWIEENVWSRCAARKNEFSGVLSDLRLEKNGSIEPFGLASEEIIPQCPSSFFPSLQHNKTNKHIKTTNPNYND